MKKLKREFERINRDMRPGPVWSSAGRIRGGIAGWRFGSGAVEAVRGVVPD